MENGFRIESVGATDKVLTVRCSGSLWRISEYTIRKSIEQWMETHLGEEVEEIVLDLAGVDFIEDDEPVASIIVFYRQGVRKFRFIASPQNRRQLERLANLQGLPQMGFSVEERPGGQ